MKLERNENETNQVLVGDQLVAPSWIEFEGTHLFRDTSEMVSFRDSLRSTLSDIIKLDYNGTAIFLNFGYLDIESVDIQTNLRMTVRLAPVLMRFQGNELYTWGNPNLHFSDSTILYGDTN